MNVFVHAQTRIYSYMGIDNYMTVQEAVKRWEITLYRLNKKLSDNDLMRRAVDDKILKNFKVDTTDKNNWIISKKFMEMWFGPEPINERK